MFIGHFGLAFATKRLAPSVSLGALFLACQLADLLWPTLVMLGIERFAIVPGITKVTPLDFQYYPYSHSLLMLFIWGVLFGLAYRLATASTWRVVVLLALLVVSHWFLDLVVHRPDLPIGPADGMRLGLGLWNSIAGTMAVEFVLFLAGVWIYLQSTVARDRIGSAGLWALIVFLAVIEVANVLGPPPASIMSVVWPAQAMWLLVAWGYWIDSHRAPRPITMTV